MRKLPPLNGIKAFEAAGRRGSFSAAGEELNVAPTAISRLVRTLEARVGAPLFMRSANRLILTRAGQAYLDGLTPLLDRLELLTRDVRQSATSNSLVVGVGPTFATRWLIPRLGDFQKRAPHIELRIVTGGINSSFHSEWTCGIKLEDGDWKDLQSEPLFPASLTPVCRPELARSMTHPSCLRTMKLLRVAHADQDWPTWLEAAGTEPAASLGPVFDTYSQALQAAVDGLGVAMGITPYIYDDLEAGRLQAPFNARIEKKSKWYLLYRKERVGDDAFNTFRSWLMEAVASTKQAFISKGDYETP